ncbi:hypothetical protein F5Y16DRAFT_363285 [Xylariaceae sp. FL0255]|nr:hypothetical protein F5Y16DRAFT_363285 [Xylariaceae sp. FL0255]
MKRSESLCLLCRLKVATAASKRTVKFPRQWQTEFSTSARRNNHVAAAPATIVANEFDRPDSERTQFRKTFTGERYTGMDLSDRQRSKSATSSSRRSEALFQEIVRGQQQNKQSLKNKNVEPAVDIALVTAIGKLQSMLTNKQSLTEAYRYWLVEIKPAIQVPGTHIPQAYQTVLLSLMNSIIDVKKQNTLDTEIPSVTDIFRIQVEMGQIVPREWATLVTRIIGYLIELDPDAEGNTPAQHDAVLAARDALMTELIESWKILTHPRTPADVRIDSSSTDGFWFPRMGKSLLMDFRRKQDFSSAFSFLFPQYPRNQIRTPVSLLAIATYTLLHDKNKCSIQARQDAARFMSKVGFMIKFMKIPDTVLQSTFALRLPRLGPYVMGLWPKIQAYLDMNEKRLSDENGLVVIARPQPLEMKNKKPAFDPSAVGGRLNQAYETRNIGEVHRIWQDFIGPSKPVTEERAAQIRECSDLIDSFIRTYMALDQPGKAIEAWNFMGRVKLSPTLRTWNMMLDGLKRARNLDGMKNLWEKLVASGTRLDTEIWTTRVGGLVECGSIKIGIKALEEMVALWKKGEGDPDSKAVKPSIGPVNAALGAMLRRNDLEAARKLLAWAARHDIAPDVFTYNTLLRALIRKDKGSYSNHAEEILEEMRSQGVQPDAATFTIILDTSFNHNHIPDPEEQMAVVKKVANAMTNAGLEPNMHTFGKMIYLLLRANNTTAAVAMVNHLFDHDVELSPHIYTALIQHCFVQRPPALQAVNTIVQRRRVLDLNHMDQMFYNRIVRGYVECGEVDAALDIYRQLASRGKSIGLWPLQDLINALVRNGRHETAIPIVAETRKIFEDSRPDPAEQLRYWGHQFWKVAERYGLLESPIPSLDELAATVELQKMADAEALGGDGDAALSAQEDQVDIR